MSTLNTRVKSEPVFTHGGAKASKAPNMKEELSRAILSTLLWENTFYESGVSNAKRIAELVAKAPIEDVTQVALQAKFDMKLRHVPLYVIRELFRRKEARLAAGVVLSELITRPDDATEFLAMWWKDNKDEPLAKQAKVALAQGLAKFSEYELKKYKKSNSAISLRDVFRLVHPKPKTSTQASLWGSLVKEELGAADTWEVALSSGADKKETFERLTKTKKLGGLAALRNVRNMTEAGVDESDIRKAVSGIKGQKLTPLNYLMSAKENPRFSAEIEKAMLENFASQEKLSGKTILVVDISGSMYGSLGGKTKANRVDAANAIAIILRERCEQVVVYATAGSDGARRHATDVVPSHYRGFALGDAIWSMYGKLGGGGIFLRQTMDYIFSKEKTADRIIVITDEQDCDVFSERSTDAANAFGKTNYILNIASYENGIGYKKFTHINGFSDRVVDYIYASEQLTNTQ